MTLQQPLPKAHDIQTLVGSWSHDRRAKGGWWALAGFSFQSAIYLLRFFQGLQTGAKSPRELAKTEFLSDVLVPATGTYTLIQVKRTLDRPKLVSAVREAFEIAKLCEPSFLVTLRFEIACLQCETPARPQDIALDEVGGRPADMEVFQQLQHCFDPADAIIVQPNPLAHLHDFLWHAGIRDTAGFLDSCLGILLRLFGDPSEDSIQEIANDLSRIFYMARNSGAPAPARVGLLIDRSDVEAAPGAETDRDILFDTRPRLADIRLGRVRHRPQIFSGLLSAFKPWWQAMKATEDSPRVPVFWIEGRSGEGKSVLLLQLIQHILMAPGAPVLSYLSLPDDLPAWIEIQRDIQRNQSSLGSLPSIAVVDDLHFVRDREQWESAIRAATDLVLARVAVLACGPTVERARFQAEFGSYFEVSTFAVPNLDNMEMQAFADWLQDRTGKEVPVNATDAANRMLVVWIFELLRGESIREFAGNFRRRLTALGILEVARTIVATNALELPAPEGLVQSIADDQRDRFQALCSASQLHFERVDAEVGRFGGYRISHPQIDWQLYREWVSPPGTLAQHWGRDLGRSLIAASAEPAGRFGRAVIGKLSISARLSEGTLDSASRNLGTLDEALEELYRKQNSELSPQKTLLMVPAWLQVVFRGCSKELHPDPVRLALDSANCQPQPKELSPHVAGWLWRLSETSRYKEESDELRSAARSILFGMSKPGIGATLSFILSHCTVRAAAVHMCKDWLELNSRNPEAYIPIMTLLGCHPDDETLAAARIWLEEFHAHASAYNLLAALVAARPTDRSLMDDALQWLENNPEHPQRYWILKTLVSRHPEDETVNRSAFAWLEENPKHLLVHELLRALVAARPQDHEIVRAALAWLQENPKHEQAYQLLAALVAGRPNDARVITTALTWVKGNAKNPQVYNLLETLVAASAQDDEVISLAFGWAKENSNHQEIYRLLATLVARCPANAEVHVTALTWAEKNPKHQRLHELLKALVAARPEDDEVVRAALAWLQENPKHQHLHELLRALVAARPEDSEFIKAALAWLGENPKHRQLHEMLKALVATCPENAEVMKAALAWLQENPNHKLPELLRPLVAAHPEHNDVITAARSWLDQNPSGSQAHEVLVTLITRSDGAEEWMQRGEEALLHTASSGKRSLLVALLIGSKADRQYIERTIELFLAERQIKNKTFLLASLSRALANNIVNALLFLAGQSAREYRRVATKALARGLRTYGNRAQEFLEMSHDSPKEYTGVLLAGCVASEVPGDILNDVLRRWLNTHQRGRGYGAVLKALNAHPSRWQALVELGGLQLGVRRDFKKLEQDGEAPAVDWFDISQRDTPKERADKTGTLGEILMEALARQAREAGSS